MPAQALDSSQTPAPQQRRRLLGGCMLMAALMAFVGNGAHAEDVSVAVAANFAAPMQQIAARFEAETGHKAVLALGSTGRFYAQIRNGAPFQVLLAADTQTPTRLEAEGLAVPGTRQLYATGRLALWTAKATGSEADAGPALLAQLKSGRYSKLALADPKLAPYGTAAVQTLQSLGLLEAARSKFVQGESIAQAYQFVATGNAQLGFVALSQVQREGRISDGAAWVVPAELHQPINQEALLLRPGQNSVAAQALLLFLRADTARAIIRAHGYAP